MSTSGSVDFTLVTNDLIGEAFDVCGIGSEGEAISADQYFRAKRSLNLIVKEWSASEHLWLRTEASVTLVASQAEYALATLFSQKPMRIISVNRRLTADTTDTPLRELSWQEYHGMSSKTLATVPTGFYFDPQRATGTLYLWPTASTATAAAQTLRVTYLRRIQDFDESNNDPDLPQEWLLALTYALASQLALKYGVKPAIRGEIDQRAAEYKARIEAFDTEPASLFLQPEWYG